MRKKTMENRKNCQGTNDRSQCPRITRHPKMVGYYSVDEHINYVPDSSQLKYFNIPENNIVSFDLDVGRDVPVCKLDSSPADAVTRWSALLKWITLNQEIVKASPDTDRCLEPNFVSTPGSLGLFMTVAYSPNDQWKVWAAKHKGTIYLRNDDDYRSRRQGNDAKFRFWGRKFEQYVVSDSPDVAPDPTRPLLPRGAQFHSVYKHQFSDHSLLYSAVRKAVVSKELLQDPLPLDKLKFIDLRTNKLIEHAGHERNLKRYKFLAWWANAFLTNDDQVLCGFRDENGIVSKLQTYETESMPECFWNPIKCIKSCERLLTRIDATITDDCDEKVYELIKNPNEDIVIEERDSSEKNCPVPEWYKNALSS